MTRGTRVRVVFAGATEVGEINDSVRCHHYRIYQVRLLGRHAGLVQWFAAHEVECIVTFVLGWHAPCFDVAAPPPCRTCDGTGFVHVEQGGRGPEYAVEVPCPACQPGAGEVSSVERAS